MSEIYFRERAEDCKRLAREERDPELVSMLRELERDYRVMAQRVLAPIRAH